MRRVIALAATCGLLAAAIWFGRERKAPPSGGTSASLRSSPAACIETMFGAAEKGDLEGWLDCFSGAQRRRLDKQLESQPATEFAAALEDAVRKLKGRAVSTFDAPKGDADAATLCVERIYAQHIERQTYHLRREDGDWRIDSMGAVEKRQPPIPYGTPVFE